MSENELRDRVELARRQLLALRTRLEQEDSTSRSGESVRDLRSIQEMLDKLQVRYRLLQEVLDRTNDIVFAKDLEGRYVMINPRGAAVFGQSVAEVLGRDDGALFQAPDAERIMAMDREIMRSGEHRTWEETCTVLGSPLTLLTATTAWRDRDGQVCGVLGIAQDVTGRRLSEREAATHRSRMRTVVAETVLSEERLRHALATELHNGIGQDIALAKLKLSMLRESLGVELQACLEGIVQLVEQAEESLRSITFQISPPSLHDLGLVAALQWLAEDVGRKHGTAVRIEDDGSPLVADERVRAILFRAVRAVLDRIAPHARGREVLVHLGREGDRICVAVNASRAEFDGAALDRQDLVLLAIQEQLSYVDGSLEFGAEPGVGTRVTLRAPTAEPLANATA